MFVVRPVNMEDLDRLTELATKAHFGLTSLPKDRDLLQKKIAESVHSFSKSLEEPKGEIYLFVLEDLDSHAVVGTSCIVSKVGGFQPFYAYRIQSCIHASESLGIRKEIPSLHLVTEHSGPSEIGGLFLAPEYRKHGNGRLLSLFRFLFMTEFSRCFEESVIAEMRGVVDERGFSPFWEALGRHFFDMDYPRADHLSAADKRFIADLMPTCPIYIPLLPKSAQDVIGQVHENTKPALKLLQDEGFALTGMIDIFEAGPIVICRLEHIRIVKESTIDAVAEISSNEAEKAGFIIANTRKDFRACAGNVEKLSGGGLRIERQAAGALKLKIGDRVRFGPIRPSLSQQERR
ncbi:MAG: arginine N-succinyltransferase [Desulfomonile tiedjei]|nr:arginine N-succinyltransferase [Desulfomonile tiedjei]